MKKQYRLSQLDLADKLISVYRKQYLKRKLKGANTTENVKITCTVYHSQVKKVKN